MLLPDFRVRQRDYLLEISRALTQELDLEKLLGRILMISIEMLAGQAGLIALRGDRGNWSIPVSNNLPPPFLRYLAPFLDQIAEDTTPDQFELLEINRRLRELARMASMGLLNGVVIPLVARGSVVGVIFIFRSYPDTFSANDHALLRSFADQAAIAVQNAQLYSQSVRSRQRLDALLDSTPDGILILAPDLTIERHNPAVERLLIRERKELTGRQHDEVIRWHKPPNDMTLEQAVAGGWPLTPHAHLYVEGDLKRNDSLPPLPVGITYAPLLSDGILLNIIATLRDITHFREAEELKSTFISIISHELKTPLALIKGYVSTLRREDARWNRDIVNESLAIIEEETDRLDLMVENLLDASRLQAGGTALKRSDIYIPDLALNTAERMQTQTKRHKIVAHFPADFPVILADENRLRQVLANLISNAIKYAPEGEIRISGQIRPDIVIICVSDQGPGIAPDDIPHIFDRFYRSSQAIRQTKGAGLGLFLSRAIVEAHGGKIWVDPETGKGARICFSLPRTEDALR
ncbi:MAG: ATP-binding protein [Chloroflexota bacterium]|jgi:K+-sensing histidine kinase KdpD